MVLLCCLSYVFQTAALGRKQSTWLPVGVSAEERPTYRKNPFCRIQAAQPVAVPLWSAAAIPLRQCRNKLGWLPCSGVLVRILA